LDLKKTRKLRALIYAGGDNGGMDYGFEVMEGRREGPLKLVWYIKNPLGHDVTYPLKKELLSNLL